MMLLTVPIVDFSFKIITLFLILIPHSSFARNEVLISLSEAGKSNDPLSAEEADDFKFLGSFTTGTGSGAIDQPIDGLLHIVSATCKNEDDELDQDVPDAEWIAVIFIPSLDDITTETSSDKQQPQCNILEMVKAAMLFGASAALLITMEPKWMSNLYAWNNLHFPVVSVSKNDAKKMTSAIKRFWNGKNLKILMQLTEQKEEKQIMNFGTVVGSVCVRMGGVDPNFRGWRSIVCKGGNYTINKYSHRLTLWSTCGRSYGGTFNEWDGTTCPGRGVTTQVSPNSILSLALSIVGGMILLLIMNRKTQNMENQLVIEDVEEALRRLARTAIMKMPTRKYKRKRHQQNNYAECAVCLDRFLPNQLVRVLPCYHSFHCKCVDAWLLKRRTCPLCKFNIIEHKIKSCSSSIPQDL
ncbi:RING finger protein 215-like isoform X1 [Anneissia japonica]|uniref:RING finger protein 215-like isoform X1 n=1 Tax=Anneissia japonica TaxID=1529436 RepID=UPI001425769C|nr:RING finger protein 215-like isoform X1 [Anneissia japonica]